MQLRPTKIDYVEIVSASPSVSSDHPILRTPLDVYSQSSWLGSSESPDPLAKNFLSDESIMEVMSLEEVPWNDTHHRSSFFPGPTVMYACLEEFSSQFPSLPPQTQIMTHEVWLEGNMGNITQTMPIDISVKPGVVENVYIRVTCSPEEIKIYTRLFQEFQDVFAWSYEEMPNIDPSIVMHKIPSYPHANPVHQWLHHG